MTLQDKLEIARRLDAFGVDYIEGGWPGSNPKDEQFFAALREEPLQHARASAFGSARHAGIRAEDDRNLRHLVDAGTPTVAIVAKSWDFHVTDVLRTTLEENLAMVADSVAFLKAHGKEVVVDAEHFFDGLRANRDYALAVLEAAAGAGADWVVLCDTNGGSQPDELAAAVADVVARDLTAVGVHVHNDGELAVANTLAAVAAGARQVQGTINGYGERVGNANLCSVIPNLVLKLGRTCTAAEHLDELAGLSASVDRIANLPSNPRLPFVGDAAFAHKGGIHVQAISIDPRTYEHVDPASVGNERRVLISELSGRNNVIETARAHGLELDPDGPLARELALKIKELESEGFRFEDAEASFELLVRRASDGYVRPFEARAYAVESRIRDDGSGTSSHGSAEVAVGGEILRGEASGGGPLDALEHALRSALLPAYPALARVLTTDFRAQVAQGGTARTASSASASPPRSRTPAVDDRRQRPRPHARGLARARRLPRVRGRDARRRRRERAPRAGAGGAAAGPARAAARGRGRRRVAARDRRDRLARDDARPRRRDRPRARRARHRAGRRARLQLRELLRDRGAPTGTPSSASTCSRGGPRTRSGA